MNALRTAASRHSLDLTFLVGLVAFGGAISALSIQQPRLAVALLAGIALVGTVSVRPVLVAVLALPALYGFQSIGVGGGLGLSDALLAVGALLSLPALAHSAEIRRVSVVNRAFACYLLLLVPSLVAHPSAGAGRELVHRLILVTAAVTVGAWLVSEDCVRPALRGLVLASCVMAFLCVEVSVRSGFGPAFPYGYHKNYAGSLLALTLLLVLCAPGQLSLQPPVRLATALLLIAGTLACQSRGAILGAGTGALIWLFSPGQPGSGLRLGNRTAALALAISFATFTGYSVHDQLTSENANTNSAGVRIDVERYTRELWRTSPVVGVGVRYFNSGEYGALAQAPNNAFDAELAEGGLVGTAGFVVFHLGVFIALWRRRRTELGVAALALFAGQFVHGQFDIYWSSGISPLPLLVAGMALAAQSPLLAARA